MAGFRAFLDWSTERTQPARVRQETIMSGFRTFLDWSYVRRKRIRARHNLDYFRAFGIPTVRHFLSYERKGRYKWTAPYVSNPFRNAYVWQRICKPGSTARQLFNSSTLLDSSTARQNSTDLDRPRHPGTCSQPRLASTGSTGSTGKALTGPRQRPRQRLDGASTARQLDSQAQGSTPAPRLSLLRGSLRRRGPSRGEPPR